MSDDEQEYLLSMPEVLNKYQAAGRVATAALKQVVEMCQVGAKVADICAAGDALILTATAKLYAKKKPAVERGIAFPVCVSVNNTAGHYSPLHSETTTLNEGDLVKVDLGAHIDGCIAVGAHTFVVSETKPDPPQPITGRQADVICAAHQAAEVALHLLRPGNTAAMVTDAIEKVCAAYKCTAVAGVQSHSIDRFVLDGDKVIPNRAPAAGETKPDPVTFEQFQPWVLDILVSTGDGKVKESDERTTVFVRDVSVQYQLKMKTSRAVFHEIKTKFPSMPFSLRALGEESKAKLGASECLKHRLLHPFPVMKEKSGEFVAQVKLTALVLGTSIVRIVDHPPPYVTSEFKLEDEDVQKALDAPLRFGKPKKSKATTEAKPAEKAEAAAETKAEPAK